MYYRSIPETPDTFYSWLRAWHKLVGPYSYVTKMEDTKGYYFVCSFNKCDVIIRYELKEIELMAVTIKKYCQKGTSEAEALDFEEKVIEGLIAAIDTKWHQQHMSYDEAYQRIKAGENKTKVKEKFKRVNPRVTDDSFYAAMYYRRRQKKKI